MCPGTLREGSLVDGLKLENASAKTFLFMAFYQLYFELSYHILSFLCSNPHTHAIVVKCDGSMYGVDVDV